VLAPGPSSKVSATSLRRRVPRATYGVYAMTSSIALSSAAACAAAPCATCPVDGRARADGPPAGAD
jgi:hypothetical protein